MNNFKKIMYIFFRIILPIFLIITISIRAYTFVTVKELEIFLIQINFENISPEHPRRIITAIIILCLWAMYYCFNRKIKQDLIPDTLYGSIPYFILWFSSVFLGIKEIHLKLKPIPLQFKILKNHNCFNIIEDKIPSEDCDYVYKDDNKESDTINLVIGDTYEITKDKLPKSTMCNRTIIVKRKDNKNNRRFYSENLIKKIANIINSLKKEHKEYNLFFNTNSKTNKELYYNVFNTGRDDFILNIYNANSKNKFIFNDKPSIKIKNN